MKTTYLIYGLPKGETRRYMEEILRTGTREECESIKSRATADGWHSFRIATHVEGERPDFARAVAR